MQVLRVEAPGGPCGDGISILIRDPSSPARSKRVMSAKAHIEAAKEDRHGRLTSLCFVSPSDRHTTLDIATLDDGMRDACVTQLAMADVCARGERELEYIECLLLASHGRWNCPLGPTLEPFTMLKSLHLHGPVFAKRHTDLEKHHEDLDSVASFATVTKSLRRIELRRVKLCKHSLLRLCKAIDVGCGDNVVLAVSPMPNAQHVRSVDGDEEGTPIKIMSRLMWC